MTRSSRINHSRSNERDKRHNRISYFANISEDAKHDEVKERALMKKKMASRRFAELLLEVGKLEKL